MHGMSVADDIIQQAERVLKENPGKQLKEIHLKVGRFMFPSEEELLSAYRFLVKDSPVRSAELKIQYVDGHNCVFEKVVFEDGEDGVEPGQNQGAGH